VVRVVDLQGRVIIAASLALLVTGTALVTALTTAAHSRAAGVELSTGLVPAAEAAAGLLTDYTDQQAALRNYVMSGKPVDLATFRWRAAQIPGHQARVATLVRSYARMPGELAAAEAARRNWLNQVAAPQLAAVAGGDGQLAQRMQSDTSKTRPLTLAVRTSMARLQAQITSAQANVTARLTAGQQLLLDALIAVCVVVALIVTAAVAAVHRSLLLPISKLRQAAMASGEGRFDTPVPVVGPPELADLGRAAELMRTRLLTALAEARQSQEIIASSHDAVVGTSLDQMITSWNPGAERLYGYTATEMIGHPAAALIPEARRAPEAEILAEAARGGRVDQYPSRRVRKDQAFVDVSVAMSPIADGDGAITGVATVTRDLTERQRGDARFRGLLEAAPDAVVCVNDAGRIELVNAQCEELFGYGRDELVGQPVEILLPDGVRDAHPAHRMEYLADPRPRPMGAGLQLAARRRDGRAFPVEVSLSATGTDEGILVIAVARDVTERLEIAAERERLRAQAEQDKAERQRHQSQRLESLGQLAGGVAHDFNNLLGVISNYAAFVAEELAQEADGGSQGTRDDVSQIQQAAGRAAELTHQLLAFARQEVIRPRVLDLNEVAASVEQLLGRTLGEHIELITELADNLDPVLADPGQIEQVLVNLAVNARDAMPAGGKLIIATSAADIDQHVPGHAGQPDLAPGRYSALRVSDTGTGIPKDVVDRIFEPFFSTKPKGQGTGLGLATVYGIISQAGGGIRIYSEPGMGTVFTILLPVTGHAADSGPTQAVGLRRGHGETVLVVEDEPAMREVTRRILARNGYKVAAAASGHDAIQAVTTQLEHIDVLLTDVVMPQMQGRELAEKICILRPGVRVVFMSGYTQGLLSQRSILEPGVQLVEKPFTEAGLLLAISEILGTTDSP
jgi:PAS domain S-box-containing protein